ncbi:MAG: helix-turn-helix transcriptional regulator [Melioribacteraceae bacterium]|nr:helix-turn-helix transcriptional regulator [Melioribacteraceae bacterium]
MEYDLIIKQQNLKYLQKMKIICYENIGNLGFNVLFLASELQISERQLYRVTQKLTGLSPNKYIREIKLQVARDILKSGNYNSILEVANKVGFIRKDYFLKLYRARFGGISKNKKNLVEKTEL